MVVKVYGPVYAAAARRVLACLIEKGIEFEIKPINMISGEQHSPDYLKLQVSSLMPLFCNFGLNRFVCLICIGFACDRNGFYMGLVQNINCIEKFRLASLHLFLAILLTFKLLRVAIISDMFFLYDINSVCELSIQSKTSH